MVKLIDYQAFLCSALLVLGLLGYGGSAHQTADQDKDRDLIRSTIATLRQASGTVNNPIASQAVQGLEALMLLDQGECLHKAGTSCVNPYVRIVVPHIGTITILPGEYIMKSRSESTSPDSHPPPVFALSQDMLQRGSRQVNQALTLASNAGFDGGQASELEFGDGIHPELPSIDFDWTNTITPNFEDDWAWLNDLNYWVIIFWSIGWFHVDLKNTNFYQILKEGEMKDRKFASAALNVRMDLARTSRLGMWALVANHNYKMVTLSFQPRRTTQ
jgi:hypothetical protein